MEIENKIDKFGEFLVKNLRDTAIGKAEGLLKGEWKAPALLTLQSELGKLSDTQKEIVKKTVISSIDTGIHDFLFALQERADFDNDIQIIVDNEM